MTTAAVPARGRGPCPAGCVGKGRQGAVGIQSKLTEPSVFRVDQCIEQFSSKDFSWNSDKLVRPAAGSHSAEGQLLLLCFIISMLEPL